MTQPQRREELQGVLPTEARNRLISAARIKDEHQKRIAVDAAIDYVKLRFPSYFQPTQPIKE